MLHRLPFFKFLSVAQVALLANRHYRHLEPHERRRMTELVRKGMRTTPAERAELRTLVDKIDVRALLGGAASRISPLPLPKRITGARY